MPGTGKAWMPAIRLGLPVLQELPDRGVAHALAIRVLYGRTSPLGVARHHEARQAIRSAACQVMLPRRCRAAAERQ